MSLLKKSKSKMTSVKDHDIIESVVDLNQNDYKLLLCNLSKLYYNSESKVSDDVYDSLVDIYTKKFEPYNVVGAPVANKNKEILPKYLGSLDKIRTEKELSRWIKKYSGPYIVTDKVDGISTLYNGKKLWTRGDGNEGTNISHILPYLNLPKVKRGLIRGEIYMPKSIFFHKYKDDFSNTRNMVTGLLNPLSKNPNIAAIKDLVVVMYEYDDGSYSQSQSQQLDILEEYGFTIPFNEVVADDDLTIEYLNNLIKHRKRDAVYDMDGLVVVNDVAEVAVSKNNPDNAIAFKIEGESVITETEYVQWNASKHGVLKPRVKVKPVNLCGVDINWATGFNAKFISDNKIGKGAKILITRSGDVIPYIKEVVEQADRADMPDENYEWNETEVDIVLVTENDNVKMRKIVEFFKTLEAKFIGKSTIEKLFIGGYDTLKKILMLTVDDLVKIDGIQKKGAQRIVDAINGAIKDVSLAKISTASGCLGMGFGTRKIQSILDVYPNILNIEMPRDEMIDMIRRISGFQKTATNFVDNLPLLKRFFTDHQMITVKNPIKKEIEIIFDDDEELESLHGKIIVFTGIRDKNLEDIIHEKGGKVTTSVSGKTTILVVSKRFGGTTKEIKAEKLGVEIVTIDEFRSKYNI